MQNVSNRNEALARFGVSNEEVHLPQLGGPLSTIVQQRYRYNNLNTV